MIKEKDKENLEVLIKYGLLIRYDDSLELYHGRAKDEFQSEEWKVIPKFDNTKNNNNVYSLPSLSTADYSTAWKFASLRSISSKTSPEVHRIVASDKNAVIYNRESDFSKLDNKSYNEITKALTNLLDKPITSFIPVEFENRDIANKVFISLVSKKKKNKLEYFDDDDIKSVYEEIKQEKIYCPQSLVKDLASALNTKILLQKHPRRVISKLILENNEETRNYYSIDKNQYPINLEYITSFLATNHIVGIKSNTTSVTLCENIISYFLFDTDNVNTINAVEERNEKLDSIFGIISDQLNVFPINPKLEKALKATPEEIMEYVMKNSKFSNYYEKHSGVWEGFTILEHTETVLRILEDTFNYLPENLQNIMKLAIIAHDMDKGVNYENGLYRGLSHNSSAKKLYSEFNIPEELQNLLTFIIGDSQKLTDAYFLRKNEYALVKLEKDCEEILEKTMKYKPTKEEVSGLMHLCAIMQTCDGGAYTRYAITRSEKTGLYYRNGNDQFTATFEEPTDLRMRKQYLKTPTK